MSAARSKRSDPLAAFCRRAPVPNDVWNDQRVFTDEDFLNCLDLGYRPLRAVKAAMRRGDIAGAKAAILEHFRTRGQVRMTKYRTDPHWSDWGEITVRMRADVMADNKCFDSDGKLVDVGGGRAEHGGIDWGKALELGHEIRRQGAIATLGCAWSLAESESDRRRYAETFERWMRGLIAARPFVLEKTFHRESFNEFGAPHWQQLTSAYVLFHWGDVLDSPMFRTAGALSDDFACWFLKQYVFLAFQFTRLLGSSWRADNHHLMERGIALYYLGVQFPEFRRAKELEDYSRLIILRHFDHNVLPDNVAAEHCSAYNYRCFVRYAMALSIAMANGRDLLGSRRVKQLQEWLDYHAYICAPDGRLVDTGDGEASSLYRIAEQSGAMLGNRVIKGVLESLGRSGPVNPAFQAVWEKVRPVLPKQGSRIYPYAGHIVMRDGWRPDSLFLHMAIKNRSLYDIHAHWNIFEFTLAAQGKRLIGNPTARTYGLPKGVTRGFYFSMDAHNTLIIDDDTLKSHRALAGKWGLQPPRITSAYTCLNAGRFDYASFTHHGYVPLIHRRDVLMVRGRYVIMTDGITMDFTGLNAVFGSEGDIRPHTYRQRIHFETGVCARAGIESNSVIASDTSSPAGVLIVPEPFENLRMVAGPSEYMKALDHPDFADYQMADIFRSTIGACFFSTVYYPFAGPTPPAVTVTALTPRVTPYRNDLCHAIRIDDGDRTDIWFVHRDRAKPKRCAVKHGGVCLETDAACLLVSMKGDEVIDSFQCGGRRTVLNGKPVGVVPRSLQRHV